jgi:tRNA dimethylallyltransferase
VTRVLGLVGPTAVGKTELSLRLAVRLDAEIVSVDSMQIYRGMDIGTAKPGPSDRARVPHHMLDLFDPADEVTVAQFQDAARRAVADIDRRRKRPLLVGGSGLYLRAVIDELRFPPRSTEVRTALEEEVEDKGAEELHARLTALDPVAAAKIEPGNVRRTIRALEVIELTGQRFSDNDAWERFESVYEVRLAGLTRRREDLYERVAARVDEMLAGGLIEEANELAAAGMSRTARQALGYRQILDAPEAAAAELRDEIVRATKRFARRQESWFKADPRIEWFDAEAPALETHLLGFFEARA